MGSAFDEEMGATDFDVVCAVRQLHELSPHLTGHHPHKRTEVLLTQPAGGSPHS